MRPVSISFSDAVIVQDLKQQKFVIEAEPSDTVGEDFRRENADINATIGFEAQGEDQGGKGLGCSFAEAHLLRYVLSGSYRLTVKALTVRKARYSKMPRLLSSPKLKRRDS